MSDGVLSLGKVADIQIPSITTGNGTPPDTGDTSSTASAGSSGRSHRPRAAGAIRIYTVEVGIYPRSWVCHDGGVLWLCQLIFPVIIQSPEHALALPMGEWYEDCSVHRPASCCWPRRRAHVTSAGRSLQALCGLSQSWWSRTPRRASWVSAFVS